MTKCENCKYRRMCKTASVTLSKGKWMCSHCGCVEDACHCNEQDIRKYHHPKLPKKKPDCEVCRYVSRCHTLKRMERMDLDKKSEYFCAFCGCLREVCHCRLPIDYIYYRGGSRR